MTRRVALITGGSRGIGFGIAQRLATEGFDLAVNGLRPEPEITGTLVALRTHGIQAEYGRGDVGDGEDRASILRTVRERFGRLDLLVNNAGVAPNVRADILEATEESFDRVLGTNLKGPYFLTQAVARWMVEQKRADPDYQGCIINVTSVSAAVASVNRGDYCLSKAGLAMSTKLWAVRLAEYGIPVYEVRPGIIETDMTSGVKETYDALIEDGLLLMPRWGSPEDVGKAVAMLARGDLPYSTGTVIEVDGGMTVARL
jgi:3-oxoacyl-[acyl-carrier protein] reductase